MSGAPRSRSPALLVATTIYLALAATTVRGVGLVGEVAIGWALPTPPTVLTRLDPPEAAAAPAWGPLVARQTRPVEALELGPVTLPLAINAYTGGPADWPARAARALTGDLRAGTATHVGLGLLLLALAHRFLRFHATESAAAGVALVLATDWSFVFYRKVLGGTEVLLHAAGLLVIWALWSRRWKGGVHGTVAIAVGAGLGLLAKATFAATLGAFGVAALLMRWDRAALRPPDAVRWWALALIPLALTLPLGVAAVHHLGTPDPAVVSHDTLALQLARLAQPAPAREGWANLVYFLGNPLAFFGPALGADAPPPLSALRGLAFAVTLAGTALEWRDRSPTSGAALLRFLSVAAPLQILALLLANRDLHHLAQATPTLALWMALAADRLAATLAPRRSLGRSALVWLLLAPAALAGALQLATTDRVLATAPRSTFTRAGQEELVAMLRANGVRRLVAGDYELYGMVEALAPEIATTHTWGAHSHGERDGGAVLRLARGGHLLTLRATAPMIYNWAPTERQLADHAAAAGLVLVRVDERRDADGVWAALYRVD